MFGWSAGLSSHVCRSQDAGYLTLNFSEVIDKASFNITRITLQSSSITEAGDATYTLGTGSKVVSHNGLAIDDDTLFRIAIGARDFVQIAALGVGSYLTLDRLAAQGKRGGLRLV